MVILKKISAATLVETLIASVIIVIVFLIASLSLNNIFKGAIKAEDTAFQNRIHELSYLTEHKKINFPFFEETSLWDITLEKNEKVINLAGVNKKNNQEVNIHIYESP